MESSTANLPQARPRQSTLPGVSHGTRPYSRNGHHVARAAERKAVMNFWSRADRAHEENVTAAEIVLGDVARYGGETAGLVVWARAVLRRVRDERSEAA